MDKYKLLEQKINEALVIIKNIKSLSSAEKEFLNTYSQYLEQMRIKSQNKEFELEGRQPLTGLLRWLGEHDSIVNRNMDLYDKIHEIEELFINP